MALKNWTRQFEEACGKRKMLEFCKQLASRPARFSASKKASLVVKEYLSLLEVLLISWLRKLAIKAKILKRTTIADKASAALKGVGKLGRRSERAVIPLSIGMKSNKLVMFPSSIKLELGFRNHANQPASVKAAAWPPCPPLEVFNRCTSSEVEAGKQPRLGRNPLMVTANESGLLSPAIGSIATRAGDKRKRRSLLKF